MLAAGLLAVVGIAGCASAEEVARDQAVESVRAQALSLQESLSEYSEGLSGTELLERVDYAIPYSTFVVERAGDGAVVTGGISARGETTRSLTYAGVEVRVCLRYTVPARTGRVTVADAPCHPQVAPPAAPGNTVSLED